MTHAKKRILICCGTRPEVIKLAPLVHELRRRAAFDPKLCVTSQHREMLDQALACFDLVPDHDLDLMRSNQALDELTARTIESVSGVLSEDRPDGVVVQGDTTTTFATALAAFYRAVPVVHVEAGLRTHVKRSPFPEELNRRMTSSLADWHFAPTERAREALLAENVRGDRIFVVGNTAVDALLSAVPKARALGSDAPAIDPDKRVLLVTSHRRESFGRGLRNLCRAVRAIAEARSDVEIVYPVHLNPHVQGAVADRLSGLRNVRLMAPQSYVRFVWLMDRSSVILTDSGGIQEEAPSLGRPVLVIREVTERPEAVEAGVAKLVGTDPDRIVDEVQMLFDNAAAYQRMSRARNPYGDGTSARRIADVLESGL